MRANIAINISKSCCFAVVLAVICLPVIFVLAVIYLPVILLPLEADAQSTVDETMSCGSSTTEQVANLIRIAASDQNENAKSIKNEIGHLGDDIADVKKLLASNPTAAEPSKQALVSALQCEYLVQLLQSAAISVSVCFCVRSHI